MKRRLALCQASKSDKKHLDVPKSNKSALWEALIAHTRVPSRIRIEPPLPLPSSHHESRRRRRHPAPLLLPDLRRRHRNDGKKAKQRLLNNCDIIFFSQADAIYSDQYALSESELIAASDSCSAGSVGVFDKRKV